MCFTRPCISLDLDELFGQCWDGQGSERSAFALQTGVDGLADDQLAALEHTISFLNRHHLDWRDYMAQCMLSHILTDMHQIDQNRLERFYLDCLNKDQQLDELAEMQEENVYRRHLEMFQQSKSNFQKTHRSSETTFAFTRRLPVPRSVYSTNEIKQPTSWPEQRLWCSGVD